MSKPVCTNTSKIRRGFTLLEMLVVVALLAATAFITTLSMQGVAEDANNRLVLVEMQEIAKAIRQFKQDTGYYPKTGPFDLSDHGGNVPYTNLPGYAGDTDPERDLWFYSPANLDQLINPISPLATTGHYLENWNPQTGRGWRGPYLKGFAEGYLDIRSGINDLTPTSDGDPTGSPLAGQNITDVPGIADPFEHRARTIGGDTLLDWSSQPEGDQRQRWGRPYLVFNLSGRPWIMSMGADGEFDNGEESEGPDDDVFDIVLFVD